MKELRYKPDEIGNNGTDAIIGAILRAPQQAGISAAGVMDRHYISADLAASMKAIEAGGDPVLRFEDDRARALAKLIEDHKWPGYVPEAAPFILAVREMVKG